MVPPADVLNTTQHLAGESESQRRDGGSDVESPHFSPWGNQAMSFVEGKGDKNFKHSVITHLISSKRLTLREAQQG